MHIDWYAARLKMLELTKVRVKEIEQEIASTPDGIEKAALEKARQELLKALFTVYLMIE